MRRWLAVALALMVGLPAFGSAAGELAVDSGWVDVKPSNLNGEREFERFLYSNVSVEESEALQTDALNIVTLSFDVKNKTEDDLYFDLDALALDDKGEVLFVMSFSPSIFGIGGGKTAILSETRYVHPGTLDRVAVYRFRFIGYK